MKYQLFFLVILTYSLSSCLSTKKITYLYNPNLTDNPQKYTNDKILYKVQPNDVLSVEIKSDIKEVDEAYNPSVRVGGGQVTDANLYITGYNVDLKGNIVLPQIGEVNVGGLDVIEIQTKIQTEINKVFKKAAVSVKLASFKIAVIGEVVRPGSFRIYNNQANIFEGIALAGDMKDFADRRKVQLIRQTLNGSEVVQLDLTKPESLAGKYYYLYPNDVINVVPLKQRAIRGNFPVLTTTFAGISSVFLILNFINNVNNR